MLAWVHGVRACPQGRGLTCAHAYDVPFLCSNKNEFTIGFDTENKPCVGFLLGGMAVGGPGCTWPPACITHVFVAQLSHTLA